jgi:hypothetical protein
VEGISVKSAGSSQGACGQRPQPTGDHRDFLIVQVASAPAEQYSVLIIHAFSFHHFGSVERAQALQKEVSPDGLYVGAAFAHESISVRAARGRGGTKGGGTYSAIDEFDFLLTQGTSAPAKQYSVLIIHCFFSFRYWGQLIGPSSVNGVARPRLGAAERLTPSLTDVLIAIWRRRAGAERKSNKPTIYDLGF